MTPTDTIPDTAMAQRIYAIHEWYCDNGVRIRRTAEVERSWKAFFDAGHTGEDLLCVLRFLKRQILMGRRNPGALSLHSLMAVDRFGQLRFTTDLGLAKAKLNVDAKYSPLPAGEAAASRRPQPDHAPDSSQPVPRPAPTAEQWIDRRQKFAALKRDLAGTVTADKTDAL